MNLVALTAVLVTLLNLKVKVLQRFCAKCVKYYYLFQGSGHTLPDEVDAMILHELSDLVGDLLIKASKKDRPHHDCCVQTLKR